MAQLSDASRHREAMLQELRTVCQWGGKRLLFTGSVEHTQKAKRAPWM